MGKGRKSDFDYLIDKFKPLEDGYEGSFMFETYGEEYTKVEEYRKEKGDNYIWTILDCGNMYASPGWHFVNRFGYILATVPWEEGQRDLKY